MCGRFALARTPEELTRVFDLAAVRDCAPRYNIAPTTDIAVVRRAPTGTRVLHCLRWGLIPPTGAQTRPAARDSSMPGRRR
jgi:putative SOS response-associated peptidase YedK